MPSRSILDLTENMQKKIARFSSAMQAAALPFAITCTARTNLEQIALYAQGRESLYQINAFRAAAGLGAISEAESKRKVTWTTKSRHIIGKGIREKAEAFDIVLLRQGRASWDIKADVNDDEIPDYEEAGKIGKSCGLKWGGSFSTPDMPHFEDDGTDAK